MKRPNMMADMVSLHEYMRITNLALNEEGYWILRFPNGDILVEKYGGNIHDRIQNHYESVYFDD